MFMLFLCSPASWERGWDRVHYALCPLLWLVIIAIAKIYTACFIQLSTPNFWAAVTIVAHSTKWHVEAVWKKIGCAFTVHSTDSASQLMGSTVQLHGLLACVPRGWAAEAESSFEHWTALCSRVLCSRVSNVPVPNVWCCILLFSCTLGDT